jgi:hypothetical protein
MRASWPTQGNPPRFPVFLYLIQDQRVVQMAGNKGKSKGGSGSAGDKRGGISKAKEQASRPGGDSAGNAQAQAAVKVPAGGAESQGGKKTGRG